MNNELMFSSKKSDWTTPKDFFEKLDKEFHFTIDLCASAENKLCDVFYSIENSALDADFENEIVFCNPPYGRKTTGLFVKKCYELAQKNNVVVMLIPARTDTIWFHEYVYKKAEIRFIKGRLKFGNCKDAAPFPSMIAILRKDVEDFEEDAYKRGYEYGYSIGYKKGQIAVYEKTTKDLNKIFKKNVKRESEVK